MNGKAKKAFTAGFVVAFLLCGVFGGLVTQQSLAGGSFTLGRSGVGASEGGPLDDYVAYNNVTLSVPDGYYAYLTGFHVRAKNSTLNNATVAGGIWDSDGHLKGNTSAVAVQVSSAIWFNMSCSIYLTGGTYWIGIHCRDNIYYYYDTVASCDGRTESIGYVPEYATLGAWATRRVSMYFDYELVPIEGEVDQAAWLGVGISFGLVAVSLLLALKSRSWAVNFLFGLSLVGFLGWEFANATTELFGGWLLFMVLVGAVLVLVKGAVLVRASGV